MSRNLPNFDPYVVLGVDKTASVSEIKSAYRKLALKCHPDKVKDKPEKEAADDFQRLQESYEILNDDEKRLKYDQEVYLAALKKEVRSHHAATDSYSSRSASNREYRDGRFYEERVPADTGFFTDNSDEARFTEEPATYSRKYDDTPKRPHTKVTEEKKKPKSTPVSTPSPKSARQSDREYVRAGHHDRAKVRTKERRRDVSDKYERTAAAFVVSDAEDQSESDVERIHYRTKVDSSARYARRESAPQYSKTDSIPAYASRHRRHRSGSVSTLSNTSDDDYEPDKLDSQQSFAKEYISRKRDPIIEIDRRPRSSRNAGYEDRDRLYAERESPRYTSRTYTRTESIHVTEAMPGRTSRRSHERLDSPVRGYVRERERERERDRERDRDRDRDRERIVPNISTASSQRVSSSRGPPQLSRSSTTPYSRSRREGSRSESKGLPNLVNMVTGLSVDTVLPTRSSRPRTTERNDSGYSSGPSTPEIPQGSSNTTAKINRYKVVEKPDREPEMVTAEPKDTRYHSPSPPPLRSERSSGSSRSSKPVRTYTYEPEILTRRPAPVSSKSTPVARPLYGEIRQTPEIVHEGRRYQRVH